MCDCKESCDKEMYVSLLRTCIRIAMVMLYAYVGGCVQLKGDSRDDVSVLVFLDGYSKLRSESDSYKTFIDVGIQIDSVRSAEMYQIVECVGQAEFSANFVGVESYQLFIRNGRPVFLVELLFDGVAIVSKVLQMKKIPGGYYVVKENNGGVPRKGFRSKKYADFFREALKVHVQGNGHEILRREFVNKNAMSIWQSDIYRKTNRACGVDSDGR